LGQGLYRNNQYRPQLQLIVAQLRAVKACSCSLLSGSIDFRSAVGNVVHQQTCTVQENLVQLNRGTAGALELATTQRIITIYIYYIDAGVNGRSTLQFSRSYDLDAADLQNSAVITIDAELVILARHQVDVAENLGSEVIVIIACGRVLIYPDSRCLR
jgi:hypothetical protein